ncbi:uncharacterized protein LOC134677807 [Cydia fagiglandana]|uniref:uncharacterized protein LOC134677807 n=1 Tax=Cydia fagiglandana TaxID=1458189 RepID=UPI002FEDFD89
MSQTGPQKSLLKPIIIGNRKMYLHPPKVLTKVPYRSIQQYKDEIIYSSPNCDFLKGESQEVVIVNRMNLFTKTCRTVARCTSRGICEETTSDIIVAAIGQKNYERVLCALSSVFNEETKVRGILALLGVQKSFNTIGTQSSMEITEVKKDLASTASQTDDSRLYFSLKERQRRRIRRPLAPYVVTEKVKKFVVNPNDVRKDVNKKKAEEKIQQFREKALPDLREVIDEDSNISDASNLSSSSWPSVPGILENTDQFLNQIDKVTDKTLNSTEIKLKDGSVIMIPVKPEDDFHIATPEVLKNVTREEGLKLLWHQAFIDFKLCLEQDEDGYYPLHIAVLHNDVDLVRRQCASLRARHESVDIPAGGLTALHMAVRQNVSVTCTNILLQNGADPLLCDEDRRCSIHLAAELDSPQLKTLLAYCDTHARSVLKNNLDFWRPELESKSDNELTRLMYNCISEMFDDQGYSPLMIAAEAAIPANVSLLAARAGPLVDAPAPDCGATALYRAVAKACLHAKGYSPLMIAAEAAIPANVSLLAARAGPLVDAPAPDCGATALYRAVAKACLHAKGYSPLMIAAEAAIPANVSLLAARAGPLVDAPAPDCGATALYRAVAKACLHAKGYSPLMIAAEAAIPANVSLLAARAGPLVDAPAPDCGATALYRAVAKACLHAKETGNTTTTPEKYLKSIEILVEHGADPSIENQFASSVNTLLTEFNLCSLSMTIANKMTALKHGRFTRDRLNMILFKNSDGSIDYTDINDVTDITPRTVETGLHAVITVDVPEKKRKSNPNVKTDIEKPKFGPKVEVLKQVLTDNKIDYKEININKLNELKPETAQDVIMQQVKLGNVIIKPKTDVINDIDSKKLEKRPAALKVHKVNLKEINDGSQSSNVTFKRLSSGQMIAITKTKPPEGVLPPNSDRKFNFIKIKPAPVVNDKIIQKSLLKSTEFDETRSAKERKIDNVVIVENVPVKTGFSIPNVTPGSSKTARARDIVISPKISPKELSKDLEPKESSMDDISQKIIIGKQVVETVKRFKKRKLVSE